MNKLFFIAWILTVGMIVPAQSLAQRERQKEERRFDREEFRAKRNAFLVTEMGLTPGEAATFVSIYDEYQQKMFDAGRECRKLSREIRRKDKPLSEDYTRANEACVQVHIKEAAIEKEYYDKFDKMLSPEQLFKYWVAEHKFARTFIKGHPGKREIDKAKK